MAASLSVALTFSATNRTHLRKHSRTPLRPLSTFTSAASNHALPSNSPFSCSVTRPLLFRPHFPSSHNRASAVGRDFSDEPDEILPSLFEEPRPLKFLVWAAIWASLSLVWFAASGDANATVDSIRASSFGLKFAGKLRSLGWPDEAVVFTLATLPVIELRGAIPVGYWMQLKPVVLTVLSVLGLVALLCLFHGALPFIVQFRCTNMPQLYSLLTLRFYVEPTFSSPSITCECAFNSCYSVRF